LRFAAKLFFRESPGHPTQTVFAMWQRESIRVDAESPMQSRHTLRKRLSKEGDDSETADAI
jgi:hypothetical protein